MKRGGKIFTRILWVILIILVLVIAGIFISGKGYVFSAFRKTYMKGYTTAHIDDYVDFDNAVIRAGTPQSWELHEKYNQLQLTDTLRKELEDYQTVGFGIFKDGQLLYEEYWEGYSDSSLTNSFSMAKSITTMLLGKAIEQGYIKGLDQRITDFLTSAMRHPKRFQVHVRRIFE